MLRILVEFLLTKGKVSGNLYEALKFLKEFVAKILTDLGPEISDQVTPVVDALYLKLDKAMSVEDLTEAVTELFDILGSGVFGEPDEGAGSGL